MNRLTFVILLLVAIFLSVPIILLIKTTPIDTRDLAVFPSEVLGHQMEITYSMFLRDDKRGDKFEMVINEQMEAYT